MYLPIGCL